MNAILGVDLEPRFTTLAVDKFIHACRAVTLFGTGVDRKVDGGWYVRILERQMNRLIFLMVRVRHEDGRKPVKGENSVGLWIVDRRDLALLRSEL